MVIAARPLPLFETGTSLNGRANSRVETPEGGITPRIDGATRTFPRTPVSAKDARPVVSLSRARLDDFVFEANIRATCFRASEVTPPMFARDNSGSCRKTRAPALTIAVARYHPLPALAGLI